MISRNYCPISTGLSFKKEEFYVTEHGFWWHPDFKARVRKYQEYFETQLIQKVDEILGPTSWAIGFSQTMNDKDNFVVDLYCDEVNDYPILQNLVLSNISADHLHFVPMGNVAKYLTKN